MADFSNVKKIIRSTRNIFDGKMEQGTIYGANGLTAVSDIVIRSVNFYKITKDTIYNISCNEPYDMYAFLYNENGKYIGRFPADWSSDFKLSVSKGQLMKVILKRIDRSKITVDALKNAYIQIEDNPEKTAYVPHFQEIKKVYHNNEIIFEK